MAVRRSFVSAGVACLFGLGLGLHPGLRAGARAAQLALPGPAPQHRSQSAAALNRPCEGCHAAIAREWRQSYHRLANQDPAFQRALAREPKRFCRGCHAPEADPSQDASGWPAENGVACVTCHVLSGQIASGNRNSTAPVPHPLRRDPRLSAETACVRCHEFQFPDGHLRTRPEFMQRTVNEHQASVHATTSCVGCHMPPVSEPNGKHHRSHRFLAGHDEGTLRAALRVQAVRGSDQLALTLTPQRVGHAFPTGDLFRRIVVEVEVEAAPELGVARRYLMRHFSTVRQLASHPVRVTASDNRLTGPTELTFALPPESANRRLLWRVIYQRVAFPIDQRGGPAVVDGEIVLDSGTL